MSGGHFEYKQFDIANIADEIMIEAIRKDSYYSKETKDKFLLASYHLKVAKIYLHRIDWLLCGDDGEEEFHERLKKDLAKLDGGLD